jgi:hypothetical protein
VNRWSSGLSIPRLYFERAWAADGVVEQLESNRIADGKIVERRAAAHVAPMEKHLTAGGEPDEPVARSDAQRDDSADARRAAPLRPVQSDAATSRHRSSNDDSCLLAHCDYQRGSDRRGDDFRLITTNSSVAPATLPEQNRSRVDVVS